MDDDRPGDARARELFDLINRYWDCMARIDGEGRPSIKEMSPEVAQGYGWGVANAAAALLPRDADIAEHDRANVAMLERKLKVLEAIQSPEHLTVVRRISEVMEKLEGTVLLPMEGEDVH